MIRHALAGILSIMIGTAVCAQEATGAGDISQLRLLPPRPTPGVTAQDARARISQIPSIVRERHPEVFDEAVSGAYLVSLILDFDGRVQKSTVTQVEQADVASAVRGTAPQIEGASIFAIAFPKGSPLPDGRVTKNDVHVISITVPAGFDESRAVSRVHDAVRRAHPDLLLPQDGPVLNRLTVLMNEDGSIQRHALEQSRREDLRRAPLEDAQFAERMAARIANVLAVDAAGLGVVGFTYVTDLGARAGSTMSPANMAMARIVLVQYAWPRKPGETAPSAPMTATAQRATRAFDERTALRLAEHYFPDAFTNSASGAGTPTIALSAQGAVIAAGRVDYGSGLNHERLIGEQLVPGIRSGAFLSPRLTNAAGQSAVVSFVWSADN